MSLCKVRYLAFAAAGAMAGLGVAVFSATAQMGGSNQGESTPTRLRAGDKAPDFTLTDANGVSHTLSEYTSAGKVVVLEWFNPGCPFVKRHHETYTTMTDLAAQYQDKVQWLAINSGGPGKQGNGANKEAAKRWNIKYPILIDEMGTVGHLYGARTTPHMFVIDSSGTVVYAGGIDNDAYDTMPVDSKTNYVAQALTEVLAGSPVSHSESRPYGCSVKYAN